VTLAGAKIGRHSENDIIIIGADISRYHAEIIFFDNSFYYRDLGSKTGSFIQIKGKLNLQLNQIIEIGSNHYQIKKLNLTEKKLRLQIIYGKNSGEVFNKEFTTKNFIDIGRKPSNDIYILDDVFLSNLHAKITISENMFYLEDMESLNGFDIWFLTIE